MLINKTFEFGPGTSRPRSNMRTFAFPPRSYVTSIAITNIRVSQPGRRIPIFIDVMAPNADSIGATGPDGPIVHTESISAPSGDILIKYAGGSEIGCPSTWRIRVQSAINDPSARVSGRISFRASGPGPYGLTMNPSGPLNLNPGEEVSRIISLSMRGSTGPGEFRIRAKWHTDPFADLSFWGTFGQCSMSLDKPNGELARQVDGVSFHTPENQNWGPKILLDYFAPNEELLMRGDWRIRIKNYHEARIVDFDITSGLDPNFHNNRFFPSFYARCTR